MGKVTTVGGVALKVQGSRFKVQGSRFKVQGSRFKVQASMRFTEYHCHPQSVRQLKTTQKIKHKNKNMQAEKRNRRALPLVTLACRLTHPAPLKRCFV
ncbi:hypothetical protein DS885_06835 [Psychromonas sp. B3M02]|nr:hypothetical protein DS885_06835 [Psychromonas sp. B3M02]